MKTSKSITKPKKTSGEKTVVKARKPAFTKSEPSEAEIREKAKEIYNQRISSGEHGTAEEDWINAEKSLRISKE